MTPNHPNFTAQAYARAVLGVVILSVTRVVCDKTKWCTADILILNERKITLLLWHQQWLGWWATPPSVWNLRSKWPTPFEKRWLRPIFAYNVSAIRDSEKSSMMTNIKSTTSFPTSYIWSVYVNSYKSTKGGSKSDFFVFWIKVNFNRIKSATTFLCLKTSEAKL